MCLVEQTQSSSNVLYGDGARRHVFDLYRVRFSIISSVRFTGIRSLLMAVGFDESLSLPLLRYQRTWICLNTIIEILILFIDLNNGVEIGRIFWNRMNFYDS